MEGWGEAMREIRGKKMDLHRVCVVFVITQKPVFSCSRCVGMCYKCEKKERKERKQVTHCGIEVLEGGGGGVRMGSPSHTALSSHVFLHSHRVRMAEGVERVIKMREKRENRARTCNMEGIKEGVFA